MQKVYLYSMEGWKSTWKRYKLKVTEQIEHTRFIKSSERQGITNWESTEGNYYYGFSVLIFSLSIWLHLQLKKMYKASYDPGLYQYPCFYEEDTRFQWHYSGAQLLLSLHVLPNSVVWCNILIQILTSHSSTQAAHFCWQNVWRSNTLFLSHPPATELHFAVIVGVKFPYTTALTLWSGSCLHCSLRRWKAFLVTKRMSLPKGTVAFQVGDEGKTFAPSAYHCGHTW